MSTNVHGLPRDIPENVKRAVRFAAGFGCVMCGNAIYQYEHVDPPWPEAERHDPEKMTLLCGGCHDKVTRGVWSKDQVLSAMEKPKAKESGYSELALDVRSGSEIVVRVGDTRIRGAKDIIVVDDVKILGVECPEEKGGPLRVFAQFYDRDGRLIAKIVDNEWQGQTDAFDIEIRGRLTRISHTRS